MLSSEQAKEIARAIYGDIAEYKKTHIEEFQRFLAEEYKADNNSATAKTANSV